MTNSKVNFVYEEGKPLFTVEYYGSDGASVAQIESYQCLFNVRVVAPNLIQLVSLNYGATLSFRIDSVSINGTPVSTNIDDLFEELDFVSSGFSGAGGTAITTFEPNKYYMANEVITYNGVLYIAKTRFKAGNTFNPDNWNEVDSGSVDTVNGIIPDANKNVQTDYVYATEAEFEADNPLSVKEVKTMFDDIFKYFA